MSGWHESSTRYNGTPTTSETKTTVASPIKKGLNQLVIKYYSGFDTAFSYGVNPLFVWWIYSQSQASATVEKEEIMLFRYVWVMLPPTFHPCDRITCR